MDNLIWVRVALIPEARSVLQDAAMLENLSEADVVNRALQLYGYLEMEKRLGKSVVLCEPRRIFGIPVHKHEEIGWK